MSKEKMMLPLAQLENSAIIDDPPEGATIEGIDVVVQSAREKLIKDTGLALIERLLKEEGDVIVYADEYTEPVEFKEGETEGSTKRQAIILKVSLFSLKEKPKGFFKCPNCKKVLQIGG